MSTLKVDTYLTRGGASEIAIDKLKGVTAAGSMLVVGEGGTVTTSLQQGLAKAWVKDNEGASDLDSFNIASITDNGTGDYTETLTNAFSSTNFSYNGTCNNNSYNTIFLQSVATNNARLTLQGVLGGGNRNGVVGSIYCGDLA